MKSCARLDHRGALKDIASEVGGLRSVPALASPLAWLRSGIGGIPMSRSAERVGTHSMVIVVSLTIGLGLLDLDLPDRYGRCGSATDCLSA
jgi:hypothetical protein